MIDFRGLTHRSRITIVVTFFSAVSFATVLFFASRVIYRNIIFDSETQIEAISRFASNSLQKGLPLSRPGSLQVGANKNLRLSIGVYSNAGYLEDSMGEFNLSRNLAEFITPQGCISKTEKTSDGRQLLIVLDSGTQLAQAAHVDLTLICLWPFLTGFIGIATYWSISRSFIPLNQLLEQAKVLGLHDRLRIEDKAEFSELAMSINQYLDAIERVVKQQEEFAVDAAHELFTPLTAMRGTLELALRNKSDQAKLTSAAIQAIHQITRLQRLTESLLISVRPREDKAVCDAQMIMEQAQARWIDKYVPLDIQLNVETAPFNCAMRNEELDCVLDNLISNALKFSEAGTSVTCKLDGQGNMSVQDMGIGIQVEDREKVFERFERGASIARGHGIGLYLARKLLEARGGKIRIGDSEIGTLIQIQLPAVGSTLVEPNKDQLKTVISG